MKLLEEVVKLIEDKGYEVGNVDATVITETKVIKLYSNDERKHQQSSQS